MLGTGTACEDKESSAVCRYMQSVHLATGHMEFRPISQSGRWESMAQFMAVNGMLPFITYL